MTIRHAVTAVAAVTVSSLIASGAVVSNYNQVVLGGLQSGHDTEGRAFVGGNFTGSAANVGTRLLPRAAYSGVDVLQVGGNTSLNALQIEAGNFRRSGTRSGALNLNSGGVELVDPAVAALVSSYRSELLATSATLGSLATDSSISAPSGQPGPMTFNANPGADGIAVFNISATALASSLVQQYQLNANGATTIIVNVSGTTLNFASGNFVGSWLLPQVRATTMWNFTQATSINLDRNWNGAILAPNAHLTNSTAIDGSVFVNSMTQNGEVHLPGYGGFVPAPGTAVIGVAGLVALRRRR